MEIYDKKRKHQAIDASIARNFITGFKASDSWFGWIH